MLNKIYTLEEYKAQGFTNEELPLIKEHDELHNRLVSGNYETTEEYESIRKRIFELVEILGL